MAVSYIAMCSQPCWYLSVHHAHPFLPSNSATAEMHDTHPDRRACSAQDGAEELWGTSIVGRHTRTHRRRKPRPESASYPAYKASWLRAFRAHVEPFWAKIDLHTGIRGFTLDNTGLTILSSQSKLSQQELADLQRATHFDKKELQQWYKG